MQKRHVILLKVNSKKNMNPLLGIFLSKKLGYHF